ncbi:conserved hypothetical protein [Candidatus Sulfopaludibacter sp. SbA4]|nr:conserved hypothetical protein [Candidatus Sulfopaludibacter sp. SbA4]
MKLHEGLLEQAQHLVRREPRRPRQVSLRRAISTAYYALFHLLVSEAILNWKRAQDRDDLARMFEHTNMRTACAHKRDELNAEFKRIQETAPPTHDLTVKRHLHLVAETFVEMHQWRENADYDYSTTWVRSDVAALVATVEAAFKAWKSIRKEDAAQAFLFTLFQKKRR